MESNAHTDESWLIRDFESRLIRDLELIRRAAFHEAGHAAAIYLRNKQKQLPPVHFQITLKALDCPKDNYFGFRSVGDDNFPSAIEGGLLIHSLPLAMIERANYSVTEHDAYQAAFEADIINLLSGSLAEAKYVAICDDEPFNTRLVNINALHNYGGASDLNKVYEYLGIQDGSKHPEQLARLFNKAFQFINLPIHWKAIERLADYILNNMENKITYEESIAMLDWDINPKLIRQQLTTID